MGLALESDADFFFVVSSVNFTIPYVGGTGGITANKTASWNPQSGRDDAWTSFVEERKEMIDFWDSLGKPVFVLTGDLEKIYRQQHTMYTQKTNPVEERIVSFNRPYVRPIKRGKQGKKTEFGGKGALVHVGGFLFLDYFEHRAFAEEELLKDHLLGYVDRFGKLPPSVVMDAKYGTQDNREMMEEFEVRASLKRRGRRPKTEYFKAVSGKELTPGIIAVIQSFGSRINLHPHLHFLVSEGGPDRAGRFHSVSRFNDDLLREIFTREEKNSSEILASSLLQ